MLITIQGVIYGMTHIIRENNKFPAIYSTYRGKFPATYPTYIHYHHYGSHMMCVIMQVHPGM